MIKRIFEQLRTYFFNGLLIILPITLTIAILRITFKILKGWLRPIYDLEPVVLQKIPQSEIIITLVVIFLVGAIFKLFLLEPLLHAVERIFAKIPLFNPIYSGIKQLVHAFTHQDKLSFQKVVLVEFPRPGVYSVGFITSQVPAEISPKANGSFLCVFIPTTPNPTTGFFIFVPQEEVIITELSRQEAMSLIISGGIIQPERFRK